MTANGLVSSKTKHGRRKAQKLKITKYLKKITFFKF